MNWNSVSSTHDASIQDLIEAIRELMAPASATGLKDRFRRTPAGEKAQLRIRGK